MAARLRHDDPAAADAFQRARSEVERLLLANPLDTYALSLRAMIDAGLGDKAKALSIYEQVTGWLRPTVSRMLVTLSRNVPKLA